MKLMHDSTGSSALILKIGSQKVRADPSQKIVQNPKVVKVLIKAITAASHKPVSDEWISLFTQALDHFHVKTEEALHGFWQAYSDKYVKDGLIEFRNMWPHIQEYRNSQFYKEFCTQRYLEQCDEGRNEHEAGRIAD